MEWILIDKENLPEGEVLAANFKKGSYGYKEKLLGYLHLEDSSHGKTIRCENSFEELDDCTHYIDIHKFDVE